MKITTTRREFDIIVFWKLMVKYLKNKNIFKQFIGKRFFYELFTNTESQVVHNILYSDSPVSSLVYFKIQDPFISWRNARQFCCHHEEITLLYKKKKKNETISEPKVVSNHGGELPTFSAVSNVDLENLNL